MANEGSFNPFPCEMPVRRSFVILWPVIALWLVAGCGGGGDTITPDEASDPLYQEAKDLQKQGRNAEALNDFLKVIDRRGENGAPESHIDAAFLYMTWAHDPVEAYHHYSKYLQLRPTGTQSDMVRGQRDAAMREIARILHVPSGDQAISVDASDEVTRLKRQIQDLEAENRMLRNGGAGTVAPAPSTPVIALDESAANGGGTDSRPSLPAQNAEPTFMRGFGAPPPAATPRTGPAVPASQPSVATNEPRSTAAPTRPATQRPAPPTGGRTHTVSTSDKSLWNIARRYYPSVNNARVQAIYEANRNVMRSPNDLRPGMVLRIP
jgi:hypothetical protein